MNPERMRIIDDQPRSFFEGVVEKINEEWIFFDHETEDAFPLEDFVYKEVQVQSFNVWNTGILTEDFIVQYDHTRYVLQDQDWIKIRKALTISFQAWLDEIREETFVQFIQTLNQLNFSVYDLLFCYNSLSFQINEKKEGVNFFIFDNTERICSIHHHFKYMGEIRKDRFEFTLNTGKQFILQDIQPPNKA